MPNTMVEMPAAWAFCSCQTTESGAQSEFESSQ